MEANTVAVPGAADMLSFGERALMALAIFVVALIAAWGAARLLHVLLRRWEVEYPDLLNLAAKAAAIAIVAFGAVTALGTIGIDVTALVAGLGLVGFALGFALRDIVSNLLAGVLVIFYKPFQRGELIAVSGNKGTVRAIDLRYTIIENEEGRILIPNAKLFDNSVTVYRPAAPAAPPATP